MVPGLSIIVVPAANPGSASKSVPPTFSFTCASLPSLLSRRYRTRRTRPVTILSLASVFP